MHIEETGIPGLLILTPARFGDARGFFRETWNRARLAENGIDIDFVQDNHSLSAKWARCAACISRRPPHAQAKLVRCGRGACSTWRWTSARARPPTGNGSGSS
jgi:dTDP-4-dehydrorhamnose 3,5-epimerase